MITLNTLYIIPKDLEIRSVRYKPTLTILIIRDSLTRESDIGDFSQYQYFNISIFELNIFNISIFRD